MKKSELANTVIKAQNGEKAAFEKLYTEYYDRLYFFVLKNVGRKDAAEDITQDAFLKSMEKIGTLDVPENYVTWLHSIAYNRAVDMMRSEKHSVYFETDEEQESVMDSLSLNEPLMLPEDFAVNKERAAQLKEVIDSLRPEVRSAVILYYYDDMSLTEVGKALGMNENAVKQKLFRARKTLKAKLEKLNSKCAAVSAMPMGEMLHRTITPKYAAATRTKSAAALSTAPAAGKVIGIAAAAVLVVGIPITLSRMDKGENDHKGDVRIHDSSAAVTMITDEDSSESSSASEISSESAEESSRAEESDVSRPAQTTAESRAAEVNSDDETESIVIRLEDNTPAVTTAAVNNDDTSSETGADSSQAESRAEESSEPQDSSSQADESEAEETYGIDTEILAQTATSVINLLNEQEEVATGNYADPDDLYNADFEPVTDAADAVYIKVPADNQERCESFGMIMGEGAFTPDMEAALGYDKVDSYFVKNGEELFFKLENYTAAHNIYTRTDDEVHITGPESFWFYVNRETADGSSKQLCRVDMVYQDVIMVGNKIWKMQSITPVTEE